MMKIVLNSTYFDSEMVLLFNAKAADLKSIKQWITKFMKKIKFSKKFRTNQKVNNLEVVIFFLVCIIFFVLVSPFILFFLDPLSRLISFPPENKYYVYQVHMPLVLVIYKNQE